MDRFFYDTLADVADGTDWGFVRAVLWLLPTPGLPILLVVDPETAFARKGEYSPEYLSWRLSVYREIFGHVRCPVLMENEGLEDACGELEAAVGRRLGASEVSK